MTVLVKTKIYSRIKKNSKNEKSYLTKISFSKQFKVSPKRKKLIQTMEMASASIDLSADIKEKVVEELKEKKLVLYNQAPIGNGAYGYVFITRSTVNKKLGTCKVIVIPEDLSLEEKKKLVELVQQEVIMIYDVR